MESLDPVLVIMLEKLDAVLPSLPPKWAQLVSSAFVTLLAALTVLRGIVWLLAAIDMLDKKRDWPWVGEISDWVDKWTDRLERFGPVKVPFRRSR